MQAQQQPRGALPVDIDPEGVPRGQLRRGHPTGVDQDGPRDRGELHPGAQIRVHQGAQPDHRCLLRYLLCSFQGYSLFLLLIYPYIFG